MKKAFLAAAAASVVLGGCIGPFANKQNGADTAEGGTNQQENQAGESKEFFGPLSAAVALGVPMKCTYRIGQVESEGYIKGKNYRGAYEAEGKKGEVILKDNCMWSWAEGEAKGMKLCFEGEQAESMWANPGQTPEPDTKPLEVPQVEYNCAPAVFGDDKFTPPANVEFADLGELMKSFKLPENLPTPEGE